MQNQIATLDALFESPVELDELASLPAGPNVDLDGDDYEVRMLATLGTIAVKC